MVWVQVVWGCSQEQRGSCSQTLSRDSLVNSVSPMVLEEVLALLNWETFRLVSWVSVGVLVLLVVLFWVQLLGDGLLLGVPEVGLR